MSRVPTASVRLLWAALEGLVERGHDIEAFLAESSLTPRSVYEVERRIGQRELCDLWDRAEALSGDEAFGVSVLLLGRSKPESPDVLEHMIEHCATLGEMFEQMLRYQALWQEGRHGTLERDGNRTALIYRVLPGVRFSRSMSDYALGTFAWWPTTLGFGPPGTRLLEEQFPLTRPLDTHRHEVVFQTDLRFDCGHQALIMRTADLEQPISHAKPAINRMLRQLADAAAARLTAKTRFADRLKHELVRQFRAGAPAQHKAAAALGLTVRTLRRRLADEGTTYTSVLDYVRRELVHRYLMNADMSFGEIAFLLGFASQSTLTRAVQRWLGDTPSGVRRRARREADPTTRVQGD